MKMNKEQFEEIAAQTLYEEKLKELDEPTRKVVIECVNYARFADALAKKLFNEEEK